MLDVFVSRAAPAQTRQPEIHDLHLAAGVDHDVLGLDVAVDDPAPVGLVQRVRDLRGDAGGLADRKARLTAAVLLDVLAQRGTFDVFDRDVTGRRRPLPPRTPCRCSGG